MKKLKYIIISILIINLSNQNLHAEIIKFTNFEAIEKKSFYRVLLLPSLLALTGYINKKTFIDIIKTYPTTTCLLSYLVTTIILDNYYQYKKINEILDILKRSEKITHYLLCAILLKNKSFSSKKNSNDAHQFIEEKIHQYSGLNITEIEKFISYINKKALNYLNKFDAIHFDFQINELANILSEEDLFIHEIIPLFENEPEIYKELLYLQNNEKADMEKILEKLGMKIKHEIQSLLEKNLKG